MSLDVRLRKMDAGKLEALAGCATEMAARLGLVPLSSDEAIALFNRLLYVSQASGGRDGWKCLEQKVITEIELRNLMMAHCSTEIAGASGVSEVDYDSAGDLERSFEIALYGRQVIADGVDVGGAEL